MTILDRIRSALRPKARSSSNAQWLERAIDHAIGNALAAHGARGFDAAQTPEWTASWASGAVDLNADLASGLSTVRNRSRQLAQNNEWAKRFTIQLRNNVLGPSGIQLQMRAAFRDGRPKNATNEAIEAAWGVWGRRENCDVSGRFTWRQIERIALNHLAVDGAYLLRKVAGVGVHNFCVQILNPNMLDSDLRRDWNGNRVRLGIEIDNNCKPIAYWLRATKVGEDSWSGIQVGKHVRVPAGEIIHRFVHDQADQFDGVPWLTVGARRLWLTQQFEEAAAVASTNAARTLGVFKSQTGSDAPPGFADTVVSSVVESAKEQGRVLSAAELEALMASAQKIHTSMPGQWDTLPHGYEAQKLESDYPHINHAEYVKHGVRGFAAGLGVSYVTLGNDLEAVNFSSARVGILDERDHYRWLQQELIDGLHADVFAAWLSHALLLAPELRGISYDMLHGLIAASSWQPRRWAGIDPVKEADANATNLLLKLTSRRRLILERGEDPDEVFSEVEQEEQTLGPIQQAPASPSAPSGDEEQQQDQSKGARRLVALKGR